MAENTASQKPTVATVDQKVADLEQKVADLEGLVLALLDGRLKPGANIPKPEPVAPNPSQRDLIKSFKKSRNDEKKKVFADATSLLAKLKE